MKRSEIGFLILLFLQPTAQAETCLTQTNGNLYCLESNSMVLKDQQGNYYDTQRNALISRNPNGGYYDSQSGVGYTQSPSGGYVGTNGDYIAPMPGGFQVWPNN